MRRPAWALLGVLLLPVFGAPVLEPHRDPGLLELELHGDGLAHEDVGVVAALEHPLQLLQLPLAEVRPRSPSLVVLTLRIWGNLG